MKNVQQGLGQQGKARVGGEAVLSMVESTSTFYLPTGQGEPRGWVTVLRECRDSTARQAWVRLGHWKATKRGVTESLATDK